MNGLALFLGLKKEAKSNSQMGYSYHNHAMIFC